MATALYDKKGDLIKDDKKKAKKAPGLTVVVKRSAVPIVVGAVAGGVSTGVALAIISKVPMLRTWAQTGGFKRAAVVTGVSVAAAGLGLLALAKLSTPKKAAEAAPFVLGGAVLTAMAPVLAAEIVARIDTLLQGVFGTTPAPTTTTTAPSGKSNDGGPLGPRRALTGAETAAAERVRQSPPRTAEVIEMNDARW